MKRFFAVLRVTLAALGLVPLLLLAQNKAFEARLKEIDAYAAKAGQDWRVPGFAVAMTKNVPPVGTACLTLPARTAVPSLNLAVSVM